jgi:acetyltransferase-like isoleucine patch superfamily enzyme
MVRMGGGGVPKTMKALLRVARRIVHFVPLRLRRCGSDSYILRPRCIDGPQYIELGDRTTIGKHSWLSAISEYAGEKFHPRLVFGNDVYVGRYACIVATQHIMIEDGCVLSEHVYIADNSHGLSPEAGLIMQQKLFQKGQVVLGQHCFIGYRACILPGVRLGEHCIVGANSVVTKSFPAYSMVAGIPATLIKKYSFETSQWVPVENLIAEHSCQS